MKRSLLTLITLASLAGSVFAFSLENQTEKAITGIWIRPIGKTIWSVNLIQGKPLTQGDTMPIDMFITQYCDIKVQYSGDDTLTDKNVDLTKIAKVILSMRGSKVVFRESTNVK
jgi:hypothetical protein